MDDATFRQTVSTEEKNSSFIKSVYKIYDRLFDKETIVLACKKGCDKCCHQVISCTISEFKEILKYIDILPKKKQRKLVVNLKKETYRYMRWYQNNEALLDADPFSFIKAWNKKPCPFLDNKICGIYPVRPIDCRTFTSTTDCRVSETGLKRFRFKFDIIANNIIIEKPGYIIPIHHLLAMNLTNEKL